MNDPPGIFTIAGHSGQSWNTLPSTWLRGAVGGGATTASSVSGAFGFGSGITIGACGDAVATLSCVMRGGSGGAAGFGSGAFGSGGLASDAFGSGGFTSGAFGSGILYSGGFG